MGKKPIEEVIGEIHVMVEFLCDYADGAGDVSAENKLRLLRNILDEMTGFDDLHEGEE